MSTWQWSIELRRPERRYERYESSGSIQTTDMLTLEKGVSIPTRDLDRHRVTDPFCIAPIRQIVLHGYVVSAVGLGFGQSTLLLAVPRQVNWIE